MMVYSSLCAVSSVSGPLFKFRVYTKARRTGKRKRGSRREREEEEKVQMHEQEVQSEWVWTIDVWKKGWIDGCLGG